MSVGGCKRRPQAVPVVALAFMYLPAPPPEPARLERYMDKLTEADLADPLRTLAELSNGRLSEAPSTIDASVLLCLDKCEWIEVRLRERVERNPQPRKDPRDFVIRPMYDIGKRGWFSPWKQPTMAGDWPDILRQFPVDGELSPEIRVTAEGKLKLAELDVLARACVPALQKPVGKAALNKPRYTREAFPKFDPTNPDWIRVDKIEQPGRRRLTNRRSEGEKWDRADGGTEGIDLFGWCWVMPRLSRDAYYYKPSMVGS